MSELSAGGNEELLTITTSRKLLDVVHKDKVDDKSYSGNAYNEGKN